MTNKEAIEILKLIKKHPSMQVYLPDEYEALDLAIKVLEENGQIKTLFDEADNDKTN